MDSALVRWFANAVLLGEEEQQLPAIRTTAPKERVAWLESKRGEITGLLRRRTSKLSYAWPKT